MKSPRPRTRTGGKRFSSKTTKSIFTSVLHFWFFFRKKLFLVFSSCFEVFRIFSLFFQGIVGQNPFQNLRKTRPIILNRSQPPPTLPDPFYIIFTFLIFKKNVFFFHLFLKYFLFFLYLFSSWGSGTTPKL